MVDNEALSKLLADLKEAREILERARDTFEGLVQEFSAKV